MFRKRAFKPGSAIGYHLQREDEIYYVLSGRGMMTIDGKEFEVGPGDAVLTRPGSSHGLKQVGKEDLVILINYEQAPKAVIVLQPIERAPRSAVVKSAISLSVPPLALRPAASCSSVSLPRYL